MGTIVITIIVMILFSAFFSGMEIAFVSANKMRMELNKKNDTISSSILSIFSNKPGNFIATMLVGNNIALVIYGIAFANLLDPFLYSLAIHDGLVLLIQTVLSTLIILITAEFLPKTLFRINPNGALAFFAIPLMIFYVIFFPVTMFTMWVSQLLLKHLLKESKEQNSQTVFSRIDLDHFVNEQDRELNLSERKLDNEIKLFRNALDFSKVKLRETMVPRTEIVALEIGSSISELKHKFIETGHSRILFYEDNIDNIIGYVHQAVLFRNPESLQEHMNKVLIVPESMPASKLLSKFIQQSYSIAIVVDEFGGTSGMVTIEDILEEIFGEIEDEHDTNDIVNKKISETEYVFSARVELDYLVDKYKLNFPQDEAYETLAGFILFHHESIPNVGSKIRIRNYQFTIQEASGSRIELVKMTIIDEQSNF